MMRKFESKSKRNNNAPVTLGSGTPMRGILFVDDMAAAVSLCS
jgi:hypothetical protein